ncbi:MAG: hypothetical protein AAF502_21435 [Bacteroidota bacterium]
MGKTEFYKSLEKALPTSDAEQRIEWAKEIVNNHIDIKDLSDLLLCEKKVASRFSWLLSDIGTVKPGTLFEVLPYLFKVSNKVTAFNFKHSFANYWRISGVPEENEAEAIDLLFDWIQSARVNVTIKSRSLFVMSNLTKKYPELRNELTICLEDQRDKYSRDYRKRVDRVLKELDTGEKTD